VTDKIITTYSNSKSPTAPFIKNVTDIHTQEIYHPNAPSTYRITTNTTLTELRQTNVTAYDIAIGHTTLDIEMPIADPLNLVQFEDQSIQNYFDSYKGEISDAAETGGAGLGMMNLGGKGSGKAQGVVACEREWSYKVLLMYVIAGFLFELWLKYHRESLDTYNGGDDRLHKDIKNNTTDNTVLLTDLPTDHQDNFGNTHQGQALVNSIRDTLERFESEGRRWEVSTR
jgi:hypothetical protein